MRPARPTVARCRLGLGSPLRHAAASDRARAQLDHTVRDLRAMGMALWVTHAEAELDRIA